MVSAEVWNASTPSKVAELQEQGKLVYCVFGSHTLVWPDNSLEPHNIDGSSFIQDLTWLLVGWLYMTDKKDLPDWYDPTAEAIKYQDRATLEWRPCTHQPNYCSFYSAWQRMGHDGITGELGVKVSAVQRYAAELRSIKAAQALET